LLTFSMQYWIIRAVDIDKKILIHKEK